MKKITVSLAALISAIGTLNAQTNYRLPRNTPKSDKKYYVDNGVNAPDWENWADNVTAVVWEDLAFSVKDDSTEYVIDGITWEMLTEKLKEEK